MLHPNIKTLTWFNFFTDFKLYAPIAVLYFSHVTGSFALGMSIFSIAMVSSALFEIPTGVFSDRIGRKKTVIYGAGAAVLYSVFYAVGQSYWILAVGAVFEGLSRAFYSGNNDALLHDTLAQTHEEHQYEEFLGRVSSMFQTALAVSAILGGFLATWSFALIMWLSVIPQVLCFVLAWHLKEITLNSTETGNIFQHLRKAYANFLSNKKLRLLSVASILGYAFGESAYQFQSAFYNTIWPVWAIGFAKTLSNLGAAVSFHFSGRLIKKYNPLKILIFDTLYSRTINTVSTAFPTVLSPLFMSTTSVFYGVTSVAKNSLLQREFTNEQRATMSSLNSFAGSIAFGVIAIVLGALADRISPSRAFIILQLFQLGNIFIYWTLFKHQKGA